jgi:hypothetical protein
MKCYRGDCFDRISNTFLKSLKVETCFNSKREILGQNFATVCENFTTFIQVERSRIKRRREKCFFNLQSVEEGKLKFFRVLQILKLLSLNSFFYFIFFCSTSALQKQSRRAIKSSAAVNILKCDQFSFVKSLEWLFYVKIVAK